MKAPIAQAAAEAAFPSGYFIFTHCSFTHWHLIPIKSSRFLTVSNLPLLSVGVLFVLCVASPRKNISQR